MEEREFDVIMVEPDVENRQIAIESFTDIGWFDRVRVLEKGEEILAYLRGVDDIHWPHLVVLDFLLPEMDAMKLIQELELFPNHHILQIALFDSHLWPDIQDQLKRRDILILERPYSMQQAVSLAKMIRKISLNRLSSDITAR